MSFFNKLGDAISDNGKMVAQKAKDVSELARLNGQLATEENRKNSAFLAIGKKVFEQSVEEVSSEYISDFSVINEANANIEEIHEKIKLIKKISHCSNCGASNSINASFCNSCGSKVKHTEKTKEDIVEDEESTENDVAYESEAVDSIE